MSPPSWNLLLVLLLLPAVCQAKPQGGHVALPPPAQRLPGRTVPASGSLTTRRGHLCTWETSGEGRVTLLVSCSSGTAPHLDRYWCSYVGRPDLCPAYSSISSQYWKQLLARLKKRPHACRGERLLKAKSCKRAPAEAHMKLAQHSGDQRVHRGVHSGDQGAQQGALHLHRAGKDTAKRRGALVVHPEAGRMERNKEEEERQLGEMSEVGEEGVLNDVDPAQRYCAEGWTSVCSFFVRFFEA